MQLLPNGKQSFFTPSGQPLANGKVYFYLPNTSTPATTYQDANGQTPNANPVILDGNGQAVIYGTGSYRQVVQDANSVTVWDQTTTAPDAGFIDLGNTTNGKGADLVANAAKKVASIAALRALRVPQGSDAQTVIVDGYTAAGDGGGGAFFFNANSSAADDGGITINPTGNAGNGRWIRHNWYASGGVRVKWFGAAEDGTTDDTTAINNAATVAQNAGLPLHFTPGKTYKFTGTLSIDYSKSAVEGHGAILDCSGSANIALSLFSSQSYPNRDWFNATHPIRNLVFKNNGTAGSVGLQLGSNTYTSNSEAFLQGCVLYNFDTGFKPIANAWRAHFSNCVLSRCVTKTIDFTSSSNAGEVMEFDHSWIVDGTGEINLNGGQWLFNGCSFGGGGSQTLHPSGSAIVTLTGCNLESQPSTGYRMLKIDGNAQVNMLGGSIVIDSGTNFAEAPIENNSDGGGITMVGVSLPVNGSWQQFETADQVRALIVGTGKRVKLENCQLPVASVLSGIGNNAVVSRQANLILNGDAETGNVTGWTATTNGTTGSTMTAIAAAAKNGSYGFDLKGVANGGVTVLSNYFEIKPGEYLCFGFWSKGVSGTGNVGLPKIYALDDNKNVLVNSGGTVTVGNWYWQAVYLLAPAGARYGVVQLDAQNQTGGVEVYYDDIIVNVM